MHFSVFYIVAAPGWASQRLLFSCAGNEASIPNNNSMHETALMHPTPETSHPSPAAKARRRKLLYAALLLLPPLLPLSSQAVVLDWNNVTWTNGSYSQSFDIDPNHAGNDITVTLSLSSGSAYTNNPAINSTFTGGVSDTNKSLTLLPDFASQSSYINVTITFLYANGVNNAKFSLFDIDNSTNNTWQDQVRNFSGTSIHNSALGATSLTGSADNVVTAGNSAVYNPFVATGTANSPNSGAGSGAGNVTADYGQSYVKSISFTYGSGTDALSNPSAGDQPWVGFYPGLCGRSRALLLAQALAPRRSASARVPGLKGGN
jgi:hypothetical protein